MKHAFIETKRLYLRPFIPQDLAQLHEFYGDEKVMRYIGKGPRTKEETQQELNRFIADWQKHNLSPFAAIHKQTGKLIGRSGLYLNQRSPYPQLGYVLHRDYWHQGFATEVAKASLNYGFNTRNFPHIHGFVMLENNVSHHILEKLGMWLETDRFKYNDRLYARYGISLESYFGSAVA